MPKKPRCKHCPIVNRCNKQKLMVDVPTGKFVGRGDLRKPVTVKARLCPLEVIAFNCKLVMGDEP